MSTKTKTKTKTTKTTITIEENKGGQNVVTKNIDSTEFTATVSQNDEMDFINNQDSGINFNVFQNYLNNFSSDNVNPTKVKQVNTNKVTDDTSNKKEDPTKLKLNGLNVSDEIERDEILAITAKLFDLDLRDIALISLATKVKNLGQTHPTRLNRMKSDFDKCIDGKAENASYCNKRVVHNVLWIPNDKGFNKDHIIWCYYIDRNNDKIWLKQEDLKQDPCDAKEVSDRAIAKVKRLTNKSPRLEGLNELSQSLEIKVKQEYRIFPRIKEYLNPITTDSYSLFIKLMVNEQGTITLLYQGGSVVLGNVILLPIPAYTWIDIPNSLGFSVSEYLNHSRVTNQEALSLPQNKDIPFWQKAINRDLETVIKRFSTINHKANVKLVEKMGETNGIDLILKVDHRQFLVARKVQSFNEFKPSIDWDNEVVNDWVAVIKPYQQNILRLIKPYCKDLRNPSKELKNNLDGLRRAASHLVSAKLGVNRDSSRCKLVSNYLVMSLINSVGYEAAKNTVLANKALIKNYPDDWENRINTDIIRIIHNYR